jgi:hypothetical protein
MAGTMNMADLAADLKASILDAAGMFTAAADADFQRHLKKAAEDFGRSRPLVRTGSITVVADQAEYAAPSDLVQIKAPLWGIQPIKGPQPWERNFTAPPRLRVTVSGSAPPARKLQLDPPPTSTQIGYLGSEYRFYYYAAHVISDTAANTTILAGDRELLLLRGQAEAMRELAMRGVAKPVQLRDGLGMGPRNAHPAALYDALLCEFRERAAA